MRGDETRRTRYAALGASDGITGLQALVWEERRFVESGGHLLFARHDYPMRLADIAFVKVGAVSGADELYADEIHGNTTSSVRRPPATARRGA